MWQSFKLGLWVAVGVFGVATCAQAAYNVTIVASGASSGGAWVGNTWTPNADGSTVLASEVVAHLAAGPTAIEPAIGGTGLGDINVNAAISWSANTTLTLWAANLINVNADITASGASAGLALTAPGRTNWPQVSTASSLDGIIFPAVIRPGPRPGITLSGAGATLSIDGVAYTLIHDLNALQAIKDGNLAGHYALAGNIDATATTTWNPDGSGGYLGFEPIAYLAPANNPGVMFSGTLQGLGHTITGLYINRMQTAQDYNTGLIGNSYLARVENLGLVGGSITAYSMTGGIIGRMIGGNLWNVYNSGEVRAYGTVGGLVGLAPAGLSASSIANSYASGNVTARTTAGGLMGYAASLEISFSFASGNVALIPDLVLAPNPPPLGTSWYGGGLVGWMSNGHIRSSYATGDVTGALYAGGSRYVGGLLGIYLGSTANISHAYATGAVSGNDYVGGLIGQNTTGGGSIMYTYATGLVTGAPGAIAVGGYGGWCVTSAFLNDGYWDIESTGQANGIGLGALPPLLHGLTSAQMLQPANIFPSLAVNDPVDVNNESWSVSDPISRAHRAAAALHDDTAAGHRRQHQRGQDLRRHALDRHAAECQLPGHRRPVEQRIPGYGVEQRALDAGHVARQQHGAGGGQQHQHPLRHPDGGRHLRHQPVVAAVRLPHLHPLDQPTRHLARRVKDRRHQGWYLRRRLFVARGHRCRKRRHRWRHHHHPGGNVSSHLGRGDGIQQRQRQF